MALHGPLALVVVGLLVVLFDPGVHEAVARAGVKAQGVCWAVSIKQADIGHATDVEDGDPLVILPKHVLVKERCEGCALAANAEVTSPEIGDGGDASAFCNGVGVADLAGEAMAFFGVMPDGLAMAADGTDWALGVLLHHAQCGVGKDMAEFGVALAHAVDFIEAGLAEGFQLLLQGIGDDVVHAVNA